MNGYQITMVTFAMLALAINVWAIITIVKARELRFKPLWIIGSLVGFFGLSINWSQPDDIFMFVGFIIPSISIFEVMPAGPVVLKVALPIVSLAVLWWTRFKPQTSV